MASPMSFPKFRAFDHSTGAPLAGGLVYTYVAGTSTPQETWSDAPLVTPNANPIVLDSNGEAWIFPSNAAYKIVLTDINGVMQWTGDNLTFGSTLQTSVSGHNLLMNGGYEIWQPGTSFVGATSLQLTDGWAARIAIGSGAASDYTISRQSAQKPGSQYCLRIQRNSTTTSSFVVQLVQNIETLDSIPTIGQYLSVSFDARAGPTLSTSNLFPQIFSGTGTDEAWQAAGSFTGQNELVLGGVSVPTYSTAWQHFIYVTTTTVPTSATELALVFSASTVWSGTAGLTDYIDLDNMQVEIGPSATNFELETFESALYRCQRRYYKSFPYATIPAQNAGLAGAFVFPQPVGAATAMTSPTLNAPTFMRDVTGTMAIFNPSVANAQVRNTTVAADCTVSTAVITSNEAHITATSAAGSAAGNVNAVHYVIDRRI